MSKSISTPQLIGQIIGTLIGNALTVWAMLETDGLIHGVLIGYIVFLAVVYVSLGVIAVAKADR